MELLRDYYEIRLNKRVADSHWWKVKRTLLDAGLELTKDNLNHYLDIRKFCPRYSVNFKTLSGKLKAFSEYLGNKPQMSGEKFCLYLKTQKLSPNQSTVSRWFKSVGGYRRDRNYTVKELSIIAVSAFTYQIKEEQKKGQRAS